MPKKTLSKTEYAEAVAQEAGLENLSRKQKLAFVDAQAAYVKRNVKKGVKITVPGIAILEKKHSKARMGRNPATGETIRIGAKTRTKARVVKALKDA